MSAATMLRILDQMLKPRTIGDLVLGYIRSRGENGATDEEIQIALRTGGNTCRPRRIELMRAGLVEPATTMDEHGWPAVRTRLTSHGRKATVYEANA